MLIDVISQLVKMISEQILPEFEEEYYIRNIGKKNAERLEEKKTDFTCNCGNTNSSKFQYKGYEKKQIGIKWFFGEIGYRPQRIKCLECGHIEYYFPKVFGLCKSIYSPDVIELGIFMVLNMGYHRVIKTLKSYFTNIYSAMTLWKSIQEYGNKINFECPKETRLSLADGTGVHIGKNKRGKELRLIMAQSKNKVFRVINITIKDYKKDWKDDFSVFKAHNGKCYCIGDGDPQIEEGFKYIKGEDGFFQRDLWHIPRQFKYFAWTDNIKKEIRDEILSLLYQIIYIPKEIDNFTVDREILRKKEILFDGVINWCKELNYKKSYKYLKSIRKNLFVIYNSTIKFFKFYSCSSLIERAMREINRREEIGVEWSDRGLLNLMKLKMCQIYNKPLWRKIFPYIENYNYKVSVKLIS